MSAELVAITMAERNLVDAVLEKFGAATTLEVGEAAQAAGLHLAKCSSSWARLRMEALEAEGYLVRLTEGAGRSAAVYARPAVPLSPAVALRYGLASGAAVRTKAIKRTRTAISTASRDAVRLADWLEAEDKLGPQREDCKRDQLVDSTVSALHDMVRHLSAAHALLEQVLGCRPPRVRGGKVVSDDQA